jgi:hypothetical protein
MNTEIDVRLRELIALWIDVEPTSLRQIPLLCREIAESATCGGFARWDPELLARARRLAAKADVRLRVCVEIQSRTGAYSMGGGLEVSPRVVTAGWEG